MDLSNIDQIPSNAHLSEKESPLYIFEDNKALIKMIIKSRSPTMRHVSRIHRVALNWLFDRINLDPKVQIKYVESKNQLAVFFFKTVSRVMRSLLHPFFRSAGKQSDMSKKSKESSSSGSPTAKAKACCLVSRESVSVRQVFSSNPKSQRSTRDFQVRAWEERNDKSGSYSAQHASGNRQKSSEDSGGFAETHASGNR